MRRISLRGYFGELFPIYFLSLLYFFLSSKIRQNQSITISSFIFYGTSIIFFSCLPGRDPIKIRLGKYIKTWTNTLIPTLIWFYSNMFFFIILPPPRTLMITGKIFSVFFIAFSVSLLIWKLILLYLSLRFSSRISFVKICYYIMLYLILFIPLSFYFYQIGISRIPFV